MSSRGTTKARISIDLEKSRAKDDEEIGADQVQEEEEDQLDGMLDLRRSTVFKYGGAKKDYVINRLIKCFGSLVVRNEVDPDDGDNCEYVYHKSPNASLNVLKARVYVLNTMIYS